MYVQGVGVGMSRDGYVCGGGGYVQGWVPIPTPDMEPEGV